MTCDVALLLKMYSEVNNKFNFTVFGCQPDVLLHYYFQDQKIMPPLMVH